MGKPKHPHADWFARAVAVVGLLLAGYTAWEQRLQRLAARPHLVIDANWDTAFGPIGLTLQNAGQGVAQIRTMRAYVDAVEVKLDSGGRWPLVVGLLGNLKTVPLTTWFDPGDTLRPTPGLGRIPLFVLRPPHRQEDIEPFRAQAVRVGILICYCSLSGECYEARENPMAVGTAECGED